MNTTVDYIKKYILNNYNINFEEYMLGTHRHLKYKNGKKEYDLFCDYAYQPQIEQGVEYWSIYNDFMDYKEWHGYGGAELDEGDKTIDKIMQDWGFKKQLTIFDFIGENNE